MPLIDKIKNKLRRTLYRKLLYKYGFGGRVSRGTWETQFSNGSWNYLYDKLEEGHYKAITELYDKYILTGSILDVGCGQGVLYHYFKFEFNKDLKYFGIDISQSAVDIAAKNFPEVSFKQLDFDNNALEKKFDVIIFNETLYYFNRPLKKIEACIKQNINPNGYFIISMCEYDTHEILWQKLVATYEFLEFRNIENEKGQKWKVGIFKP